MLVTVDEARDPRVHPTGTGVVHLFYSGPSGASAVAVNLACHLAGRLPQAALLYGVPAPREAYVRALEARGVPWDYARKAPGPQPAAYARTARLLASRARGGWIVAVHGLQLFPVLGALRVLHPRVATLGYVHGPTEELHGPGLWRALGSVHSAAHLICVTEELRGRLGRLPFCGRAARSAVVVPNGIDTSFWRPDSDRRPPSARELHLCFSGVLTPRKRAGLALEALAGLLRQGVAARLEICGDGPEREHLEHRAGDLGLREAVEFRGLLAPEGLRDALAASHALVHPSRSEGLSMAVLEALACGCPAIVCATPLASESESPLGREAGATQAVQPTAEAMASALAVMAAEPAVWSAQSERARRAALTHFSLDDQAERFLAAVQTWWPGTHARREGS
jgi:glycosyltransferase involved in cell wall biosynthesis